jgi:hypothetical protein
LDVLRFEAQHLLRSVRQEEERQRTPCDGEES